MRYAVYFTPPLDHPLWRAGCEWLQRDPSTDAAAPPTRDHVREPWRYGFHATLKPPMRLAEGRDATSLIDALTALAADTPRFEMPALSVRWLSGFLALRPREPLPPSHALHRLADACVTHFDPWRAPPTPEEAQRRLAAPLDDTAHRLLQRWGYAHVFDHWRFHMTLTDTLPDDLTLRQGVEQAAQAHFAEALRVPLACDALSLFVEAQPGAPLKLRQRFPLA
ncbi:MAG: DUF1045 domain-containing protein [Rhizobacter sp.]